MAIFPIWDSTSIGLSSGNLFVRSESLNQSDHSSKPMLYVWRVNIRRPNGGGLPNWRWQGYGNHPRRQSRTRLQMGPQTSRGMGFRLR